MCILTLGAPLIRNFGDEKSCTRHNLLKIFEIARFLNSDATYRQDCCTKGMYIYPQV